MRAGLWVWVIAGAFLAGELYLSFRITNWGYLDEATYIQAAVRMIYGPQCGVATLFPTVCNYEHPPLAKAFEALSLLIFGGVLPTSYIANPINGPVLSGSSTSPLWFLAFRFFQLVFGTLSVVLMYVVALSVSKNRALALISAAALTLEPIFAFFSRTAFLDVPMVFFALCAYAVYFRPLRLGPVSETWLTGLFFGLSALCKESGAVFFLPLVVYHLLFRAGSVTSRVREAVIVAGTATATFCAGLQVYDTLAHTPFPTFASQISYMLSFSSAISCRGFCTYPPSPLDWFLSYSQAYWFDGFSPNLVLLWLVIIWVPVGSYLVWRKRGSRPLDPESRLFVLAALVFFSGFISNYIIYLVRGVYAWYYLTLLPGLCLGAAYLMTRPGFPRWLQAATLALLIVGYFWAYEIGITFLMYN